MADYKDIINGTLSSLVDKVKEAANSSTVRGVYEQGASRAKVYGRIAKLGLEINGEAEELKRVYTEIGKLYYEQAKEDPQGFFAPLFAQAAELSGKIAAKEQEIEDLKAGLEAEHTGVEVEIEVSPAEAPDDFDQVVSAVEDAAEAPSETPEE